MKSSLRLMDTHLTDSQRGKQGRWILIELQIEIRLSIYNVEITISTPRIQEFTCKW